MRLKINNSKTKTLAKYEKKLMKLLTFKKPSQDFSKLQKNFEDKNSSFIQARKFFLSNSDVWMQAKYPVFRLKNWMNGY